MRVQLPKAQEGARGGSRPETRQRMGLGNSGDTVWLCKSHDKITKKTGGLFASTYVYVIWMDNDMLFRYEC